MYINTLPLSFEIFLTSCFLQVHKTFKYFNLKTSLKCLFYPVMEENKKKNSKFESHDFSEGGGRSFENSFSRPVSSSLPLAPEKMFFREKWHFRPQGCALVNWLGMKPVPPFFPFLYPGKTQLGSCVKKILLSLFPFFFFFFTIKHSSIDSTQSSWLLNLIRTEANHITGYNRSRKLVLTR